MEGSGGKGRGRRIGGRGRCRKRERSPAREQETTIPIYQTPASQCTVLSMEGRGKGKGRAIGIDLGSSHCCVAVWRPRYNLAEIIKNEFGNRLTPSMVSFTSLEAAVGEGAYSRIAFNHVNTVFDLKRLVGMCFSDSCLQNDMKFWPFIIIEGADDKPLIQVTYREETKLFTPQDILSMLLMKMKAASERYLECDAKDVVITVPAYFNDAQKRATEDAGKIAGLNVIQVLNEPTAAAIAYGFHDASDEEINLLVFDLGGGTFDVSVLSVERGKITVKAINGNVHLGGQDFDNRLVNYCVENFNIKYKVNVNTSFRALRRLRVECETAKEILSCEVEFVIYLEGLYEGKDFFLKISRTKFEELNADLFEECIERTRKCLEDAHLNSYQIQDIILVGGSTRIPKLQELIRQNFGKEKLCNKINPDEVVAYGAAVQAAALNNEDVSLTLTDVTPLDLGTRGCEVERTHFIRNL